jgi:hypothetical protein
MIKRIIYWLKAQRYSEYVLIVNAYWLKCMDGHVLIALNDKIKNRKMYSSVELADVLRTTPEQAVSWIVEMKGKGYKTFYSNHGQRYIEAKAVADQFGG